MEVRHICVGIKGDGVRCTARSIVGEERCRIHLNTVHNNGPNETALRELKYTHNRLLRELENEWDVRIENAETQIVRDALIEDFNHVYNLLKIQQRHEVDLLRRAQQERVRQTGIDPDAQARERRFADMERRRQEALLYRARNPMEELNDQDEVQQLNQVVNRAINVRPRGELENFARDNQNVHTYVAVTQTKQIVNRILRIPIPREYKWNTSECSKTPGEIAMTCHLTPRAAWQMFAKYCHDESIYELGNGIYGKVLDGVWQYILGSPNKTDLCRVLRQEMEDNIGMCAQGNLSRLCNILAGYMEGIGSQESTSEVLGRLMPKLMEIEDLSVRLNEAYKILKDNHVPFNEWKHWVDALMIDQDVEMAVSFIKNSQDEIIGIFAVVG